MTVKIAYYIAAAVLLIASIWTVLSVKEYEPKTYNYYHGISDDNRNEKLNLWQLLKTAPKQFWQISVVQFFNWFALMYLWTYSTGAIAKMYGMRQTLLQQDIKQQGTGMVCYTVYNF